MGLTTALRLCEMGRRVILIEAMRIGGQVTGRSTAKITTQHGLIYRHLLDTNGLDIAQRYAHANSVGAACIRDWIRDYRISCDFERKPAYAYTASQSRIADIEAEAEAARQLGLRADVVRPAPLPFKTAAALRFPDQAQFNPAAYLTGLAEAVTAKGGLIFEMSRVRHVGEASRWRAVTDHGTVHAEHIVVATNMTIKSPVGMSQRTQPRSHAAMAFRVDDPRAIDGMFLCIDDPGRSIRTGRDEQGPLLVVLGPRFNTGQVPDVAARFRELEEWARANLPAGEAVWHWCNEDYDTADRIPYAGEPDKENAPGFHIATGFNAWGISNGTAAGLMIADAICGEARPWQSLYDPTRPYAEDFHQDADSQSLVADVSEIEPREGGVLVRGEEKIAVWRDDVGETRAVSAACTHMGCTLSWNNVERTWDCPCHGSIFAADGSVIHGPARMPLKPAKL